MMHWHAVLDQGWWWPHELLWVAGTFIVGAITLAAVGIAVQLAQRYWGAEEILRRRYARGEVDREGFEQALAALRH